MTTLFAKDRHTSLVRLGRNRLLEYLGAAFGASGLTALAIWPLSFTDGYMAREGADELWFQIQAAISSSAGPMGTSTHLNWPLGVDAWSLPQSGLLLLGLFYVCMNLLGLGSLGALDAALVVAAGSAACTTLFFFRSLIGSRARWVAATVAAVLCGGPYVAMWESHLNVSTFYLLPLTAGVVLRISSGAQGQQLSLLCTMLAVGALLAPLWWIAVCAVLILSMALWATGWLGQPRMMTWLAPLASVVIGAAVPYWLASVNAIPNASTTRTTWDSNAYGGHLVDILTSSPFINTHSTRIAHLLRGGSVENTGVGTLGALLAAGCFIALLAAGTILHRDMLKRTLYGLSLSSFLLFVTGGLGNLQAGAVSLLGGVSPARVWSRLLILLAILGAGWLLVVYVHLMERRHTWGRRRIITGTVLCLSVASALMDLSATSGTREVVALWKQPEASAVAYLAARLMPCPVAQLPADSVPISPTNRARPISDYYYRGYVPYLIAPDFSWSFGGDVWSDERNPVNDLETRVGPAGFTSLADSGYCAVMFDKRLSAVSASLEHPLPGTTLSGIAAPSFENERFQVYLLK